MGNKLDKTGVAYLWQKIKSHFKNYTAGKGIEISDDNVISCTLDTTVFKVVNNLPVTPADEDKNKIFLVKAANDNTQIQTLATPGTTTGDATAQDIYNEYLYVDGKWELLGTVKGADIDLSDYITTKKFEDEINEINTNLLTINQQASQTYNALHDELSPFVLYEGKDFNYNGLTLTYDRFAELYDAINLGKKILLKNEVSNFYLVTYAETYGDGLDNPEMETISITFVVSDSSEGDINSDLLHLKATRYKSSKQVISETGKFITFARNTLATTTKEGLMSKSDKQKLNDAVTYSNFETDFSDYMIHFTNQNECNIDIAIEDGLIIDDVSFADQRLTQANVKYIKHNFDLIENKKDILTFLSSLQKLIIAFNYKCNINVFGFFGNAQNPGKIKLNNITYGDNGAGNFTIDCTTVTSLANSNDKLYYFRLSIGDTITNPLTLTCCPLRDIL